MIETIKKSVEETDARVRDILDFIKSDYPKASSQKEHEHNIEIVDYAVNQCKYGLKEKLRQSFNEALLTAHLALLEDLIKREEGEMKDWLSKFMLNHQEENDEWGNGYANAYKEAKTDTINHLKALREEITSLIK